ncbi:hypothetical protein N9S81_00215 [bacterium]|nr:hypothetical protein [bacterium]
MYTFQRFEVVSAPVEERLADSVAGQVAVILERLATHRKNFQHVAGNKVVIEKATRSAIFLLSPGQLPFFFFATAFLLRVLYTVLVGVRARRMLERAGQVKAKGE